MPVLDPLHSSSATGPRRTSPLSRYRLSGPLQASVIALALLLLWDFSGLDLWAVRLVGGEQGFAWRERWLTAGLMHQGGRWLALSLILWMLFHALHVPRWSPWAGLSRRERWVGCGVMALSLALIPLLKRASQTSCPWDLAEFGGNARYVSHWAWGVLDGGSGHCFPSGHASSAFAFLAGYFMLRRSRPRQARLWLGALLLLGTGYGLAQMARGAHYPSHTMWTAWICWTLAALSERWMREPTPAQPA